MTEYRVVFSTPVVDAVIVPADQPLYTPKKTKKTRPAAPVASAAPDPPTAPVSLDLWQTQLGQELLADRKQIETVLGNLHEAAHELQNRHSVNMDKWVTTAIDLALVAATQLLHQQVSRDEYPIESLVREIAAQLETSGDTPVSVHLNPKDVELLEKRLDGKPLFETQTIQPIPDHSLGRCECLIEGVNGHMLMHNISMKLQQLRENLLREITHG